MGFFYLYCDESGKLAQSDVTSFCGYVGHARECERVMAEWDNCRFAWGVPPIHMRCVMFPERNKCDDWLKVKQDWGAMWETKRDVMLKEFAGIVMNSHLAASGFSFDTAHFRAMPDSKFKREMRDPLFLGFFGLVRHSLGKIDRINKTWASYPFSVIIDDDEQYSMDFYQLLNALKQRFPDMRDRVTAITFGDDRQYPALQMADMLAFESRALALARMSDPKAEPSELYFRLTRRGIHRTQIWTAAELDEAARLGNMP